MNVSAAPSDIDSAEAAMADEHCVMLKRLADIGMALVEKLAADVEAGTAKGDRLSTLALC